MQPLRIIEKYYEADTECYRILVRHSRAVQKKAFEAAKRVGELNPDLEFIKEAAMLHDIGVFLTAASDIGCNGKKPYICHGILGREVLEKEGLPRHALVAERHVGCGISKEEIIKKNLPLPKRDMMPISIEEQIICFADKFFSKSSSKNKGKPMHEKSITDIKAGLAKFGPAQAQKFEEWLKLFKE